MSIAAAAIYKWVDEQGVIHYSATPPAQRAEQLELPPPPSADAVREARERLEQRLQEQRTREEERRIEQEEIERQQRSELRDRLRSQLSCLSAKSTLSLFQTPRPVYRFNARCERVFVTDADRKEMIGLLERYIERACTDGRGAATDPKTARLAERIKAFYDRYRNKPGEPIAYPDFADDDLLNTADFCRCAPVFLREMAKPEYRTPDSEIEQARRRVRARCPGID
jgi:hypothetical protein